MHALGSTNLDPVQESPCWHLNQKPNEKRRSAMGRTTVEKKKSPASTGVVVLGFVFAGGCGTNNARRFMASIAPEDFPYLFILVANTDGPNSRSSSIRPLSMTISTTLRRRILASGLPRSKKQSSSPSSSWANRGTARAAILRSAGARLRREGKSLKIG